MPGLLSVSSAMDYSFKSGFYWTQPGLPLPLLINKEQPHPLWAVKELQAWGRLEFLQNPKLMVISAIAHFASWAHVLQGNVLQRKCWNDEMKACTNWKFHASSQLLACNARPRIWRLAKPTGSRHWGATMLTPFSAWLQSTTNRMNFQWEQDKVNSLNSHWSFRRYYCGEHVHLRKCGEWCWPLQLTSSHVQNQFLGLFFLPIIRQERCIFCFL